MRVTDAVGILEMVLDGRISGRISEWPQLRPAIKTVVEALSHAAGQEVVDCVRSSELWYAIDEAKNPADFLARAIAILQRSNMAMVDNTAVLEPAVAEEQERRLLRAGLLLRALSRGVPEGK